MQCQNPHPDSSKVCSGCIIVILTSTVPLPPFQGPILLLTRAPQFEIHSSPETTLLRLDPQTPQFHPPNSIQTEQSQQEPPQLHHSLMWVYLKFSRSQELLKSRMGFGTSHLRRPSSRIFLRRYSEIQRVPLLPLSLGTVGLLVCKLSRS